MQNIIDEIAEARYNFLLEGVEPNTVIIPESKRAEIWNSGIDWVTPGALSPDGKKYVFGCEIMYSPDADKIKVGYLKQ